MTAPIGRIQPAPGPGARSVVDDLVVLLNERRDFGARKYGTELKTWNGRDAELDALQEAVDLVQYVHQGAMERADLTHQLVEVEADRALLRAQVKLLEERLSTYRAVVPQWVLDAAKAGRVVRGRLATEGAVGSVVWVADPMTPADRIAELEAEVAKFRRMYETDEVMVALSAAREEAKVLREALEKTVSFVERSKFRLHYREAPPMFICVCDAASDDSAECVCPHPAFQQGCRPDCEACSLVNEKATLLEMAHAALERKP